MPLQMESFSSVWNEPIRQILALSMQKTIWECLQCTDCVLLIVCYVITFSSGKIQLQRGDGDIVGKRFDSSKTTLHVYWIEGICYRVPKMVALWQRKKDLGDLLLSERKGLLLSAIHFRWHHDVRPVSDHRPDIFNEKHWATTVYWYPKHVWTCKEKERSTTVHFLKHE